MKKIALSFGVGVLISSVVGVAAAFWFVETRVQRQPLDKPEKVSSSVPVPSPSMALTPLPSSEIETAPIVIESTSTRLYVEVNKKLERNGLSIFIDRVLIAPDGAGIEVRVRNNSDSSRDFFATLMSVVIDDRQIDFSKATGELSGVIRPGVLRKGILGFIVERYPYVDVDQVQALRLYLGSKDLGEVTLVLRDNGSKSKRLPISQEPQSDSSTFNAEIFDPPSNCRSRPESDSPVKKVLQRGDILVDRNGSQTDPKSGVWYKEQYLDCWIHASQIRFK